MHRANLEHAELGRKAITVGCLGSDQELGECVREALINIGHLCDAERIDFVRALKGALNSWAVERIDPNSVEAGPTVTVEITIGAQGLPAEPKAIKRPDKRGKSRAA
jgi:hypothetical protein